MIRVKICGISDVQSANTASESGADFLGFVFAVSPRQIVPDRALSIINEIKHRNSQLLMTGVFVNTPAEEVNHIAKYCHLDFVQLSGDESWEYCLKIEFPVIKVIHIVGDMTSHDIINDINKGHKILSRDFICLLDAKIGDIYGGTGYTFDWRIAKTISDKFPVIIAGGLNPDNIGKLLNEVKPWGVDTSSGIETNGRKDNSKIRAFINQVKNFCE